MNSIFKAWMKLGLIQRILIGMVIGLILGLTVPQFTAIGILGNIFVGALKAIAPILVFVLVMSSLASAKSGTGSNMKSVILLYGIGTLASALIAVAVNNFFPVSIALSSDLEITGTEVTTNIAEVLKTLVMNLVTNPVSALYNANYIGILSWAIIFGIAIKNTSEGTKKILSDIADATSQVVKWVINCAPFGILGLVFTTVSETGISGFATYGKLLIVLVSCMLGVALILNPLIVFFTIKQNPYPLVFKCLRESAITAFFTRSSAANIPVNMELCKSLGLDEDTYSVSIPLGATVNMAGAAITITTMSLAAVHTLGISVDLPTMLILSILASVAAAGTSGVAGGSLMLIPLACSLFGISNDIAMQVVGIGFIIGVIQDSCETALNSSTDALFTAAAEFRLWRKNGKALPF
ncbi:serine/threonine transporter SstT [Anaerocolumna sedimenticola]|uniref:Serine/threonine transporter SstT n=1 Tax=Anaerocolumna sedimenticola TaxID=2696063 RepID=A0A6P1THK9_9FIRM|nr:serine/threonine transporter SstT [Anaerocolumna sedimenticola]QHQ59582.1 serine/threonine transporter SstT [Anaerocolumna sedimenticola]